MRQEANRGRTARAHLDVCPSQTSSERVDGSLLERLDLRCTKVPMRRVSPVTRQRVENLKRHAHRQISSVDGTRSCLPSGGLRYRARLDQTWHARLGDSEEAALDEAELSLEAFLLELVEQTLEDTSLLAGETVLVVDDDRVDDVQTLMEGREPFAVVVRGEHGEHLCEREVGSSEEGRGDRDWDG
jgi:hypothetical protein